MAPSSEVIPPNVAVVYVDSNFEGSRPDVRLRSHTGIVTMSNGAPICAKSVLERIIADSSETVAMHSAAKETMSVCNLFEKLQINLEEPIFEGQLCKDLHRWLVTQQQQQVLSLSHRVFVCKGPSRSGTSISKVKTLYQLADPMTNQLPEDQFVYLVAFLRGIAASTSSGCLS